MPAAPFLINDFEPRSSDFSTATGFAARKMSYGKLLKSARQLLMLPPLSMGEDEAMFQALYGGRRWKTLRAAS